MAPELRDTGTFSAYRLRDSRPDSRWKRGEFADS